MPVNFFYRLDPRLICLVLAGVLVIVSEIGFRLKNRRITGPSDSIEKADIALIIGAVLTLLALLLGFTYAMSESRFEARRQLAIDEANAIGTTYLRAKTLPEPRSSEIQELLRRYTALQIEKIDNKADELAQVRDRDNRAKKLHGLIWAHAIVLARENASPITALFLQTLNEMIDLHTKRLAAYQNRVPVPIYTVLFIVSAITLWLVGFYFGSHRQRALVLTTLLAILVASVMWLIMDLDQPVRGSIQTSKQSLFDLHQDLNAESGKPIQEFKPAKPE
ncbi:MAG: hypothetical protein V2B19_22360 [Pseudomonadota bacterium]